MSTFGQGSVAALNEYVIAAVNDVGSMSFSVSGTWVGVLEAQISNDEQQLAWEPISFTSPSHGWRLPDLVFNDDCFVALTAGARFFRILAREWTSGTANITIYGTDGTAERIENYGQRILSGVSEAASGTRVKPFFNIHNPQTILGLSVSSVTNGPVAAPDLLLQARDPSEAAYYDLITFAGAGTLTNGSKRMYLLGPGCFGGNFDGLAGFAIPRDARLTLTWTLTGGQAITYDVDVFANR